MTPFEIALAVRHRADQDEDIKDFVLRTMPGERVSDFGAALDLLVGWESAFDDLRKLIEILRPFHCREIATIDAMVKHKRTLGYDPGLEALMARRWRCPHCKQLATISEIGIPVESAECLPTCKVCGAEGIAPVKTEPRLDVRDGGKSGLRPT